MKFQTNSDYWNKKGKYQELMSELSAKMPDSGDADTVIGQQVIALNRIGYDWFNNGFCNVSEWKYTGWNDKYDEEEGHLVPNNFYLKLIVGLTTHITRYVKLEKRAIYIHCLTYITDSFVNQYNDKEELSTAINYLIDETLEVIASGKIEDKQLEKRY